MAEGKWAMNPQNEHIAKRWVETKYPDVRGPLKSMLILAFGAGIDWGMKEAQDIIETQVKQMKLEGII
jgi:hypothetical protein